MSDKRFAWMAYSRWRSHQSTVYRYSVLIRQTCFDLFMKYKIPLASLSAVRTLADGVNAEFTFMMIMQQADILAERQLLKIVGSLRNRSE